jgi:hypothetical protein
MPTSAARASTAAWTGMVQRAPTDRPVTDLPVMPAESEQPATSVGNQPCGDSGEADLDQLAEDVFGRLRWRLVDERERRLGWSN